MGRRRDAPAACSRGGESPACGVSGASRQRSAWDLVVDVARGMRNALMRSEQWIGARGVVLAGDGEVERWNIAGVRCAGN